MLGARPGWLLLATALCVARGAFVAQQPLRTPTQRAKASRSLPVVLAEDALTEERPVARPDGAQGPRGPRGGKLTDTGGTSIVLSLLLKGPLSAEVYLYV